MRLRAPIRAVPNVGCRLVITPPPGVRIPVSDPWTGKDLGEKDFRNRVHGGAFTGIYASRRDANDHSPVNVYMNLDHGLYAGRDVIRHPTRDVGRVNFLPGTIDYSLQYRPDKYGGVTYQLDANLDMLNAVAAGRLVRVWVRVGRGAFRCLGIYCSDELAWRPGKEVNGVVGPAYAVLVLLRCIEQPLARAVMEPVELFDLDEKDPPMPEVVRYFDHVAAFTIQGEEEEE